MLNNSFGPRRAQLAHVDTVPGVGRIRNICACVRACVRVC